MLNRLTIPVCVVLVACSSELSAPASERSSAYLSNGLSADAQDWQIRVLNATPVLAPNASGCLAETGEVLPADSEKTVLATDGALYLLDEDGSCVSAADVEEIYRPDPFPLGRAAVVQIASTRYVYDASRCPAEESPIAQGTSVEALARSYDANFHGYAVIDRQLHLAPVRHVDAEGWIYPWHSSVQIVKQVPEGFLVGGGVIVGPHTILTAAHLGVDSTYCYSREPVSAIAWAEGKFVCDNITGPAEQHPDGVDLAIVHLNRDEAAPYARVRRTLTEATEDFFTAKWSQFNRHAFADSVVDKVTKHNAFCENWPTKSTFISTTAIGEGGDSGGPAWIGDELVGIVHGRLCEQWWHPPQHVWINLSGVLGFIDPYLVDSQTGSAQVGISSTASFPHRDELRFYSRSLHH